MSASEDLLRRIAECDRDIAASTLPNVRERAQRAKRSWQTLLAREQHAQSIRDDLRAAKDAVGGMPTKAPKAAAVRTTADRVRRLYLKNICD